MLVPFLTTMDLVAPLENNAILYGTSIQSFRHLELHNPSIISDFRHRSRMVQQFRNCCMQQFRNYCTILDLCLKSEIMDGFWSSRCLNDRIDLPDKIESFLSGATTPMVLKAAIFKCPYLSRLKSYRAEIQNLS